MNQLEALKQFTTVVADSGDIESIRNYHPEDATTNPSLILKASGLEGYKHLMDDAIEYAKKQGGITRGAIVSVSSSSIAVVAMWSLIWCGTAARCLVCRPAVALSRS